MTCWWLVSAAVEMFILTVIQYKCVFFSFGTFAAKFWTPPSPLQSPRWELQTGRGPWPSRSRCPWHGNYGTYELGAANLEDILDSEDGGASWLFRLFGRRMTSFQPFHDRSKVAVCTARNRHGVSSIVALYTVMLYTNVRTHTHTQTSICQTP